MKTWKPARWLCVPLQTLVAAVALAQSVPFGQWTPQEHHFVAQAREEYQRQGLTLTREQEEIAVYNMRAQIAQVMGVVGGIKALTQGGAAASAMGAAAQPFASAPAPAVAAPVATLSEAELAQRLSQWPPKPALFEVRERPDGFDINGQPILDAAGRIFSYAVNPVTGAATYAREDRTGVQIKAVAPQPPHATEVIATARQTAQGWEVSTVTGQQLVGNTLTVLSDGFMLGRGSAAFRYQIGVGTSNVGIPQGYMLAPLQRGDIGSTGYVLIEKEGAAPAASDDNPIMGLFSATKALGATLGLVKKEDFALLHMASGQLYPLNIPADGKSVALMSECKRQNFLVNKCKRMDSFESLYEVNGFKNKLHYFWQAQWLPSAQGPIALTQEEGVSRIYATDLTTGHKVQVFHRALGIADWSVTQHADGRISVAAQLGFESAQVPDIAAFMAQAVAAPAVEEAPAADAVQPEGLQGIAPVESANTSALERAVTDTEAVAPAL